MKQTPNPASTLLANAIIAGAGLGIQPNQEVPDGMAAVLLYVPENLVVGKNMMEIQNDLGLPWNMIGGEPVWLADLIKD